MREPRPPEPEDEAERARGSGSMRVPSDLSALDDLPPYDQGAVPPFARGSRPHGYGDGRGTPLDMSKDPDRFDPNAQPDPGPVGPLDPALDPDRFRPQRAGQGMGQGQTLDDLLGDGSHEGERDGYEWILGLIAVLVFLALVGFIFSNLGP